MLDPVNGGVAKELSQKRQAVDLLWLGKPGHAGGKTEKLAGRYRWWPDIGGMVRARVAVKRGRYELQRLSRGELTRP